MGIRIEGLSDAQFAALYSTEDQCQHALIAARMQEGMTCYACGHTRYFHHAPSRRFGCTRCNIRWSYTQGTVMQGTKLPLTTWFLAMHLMCSTKQGISSIELARRLGISQNSAWFMQHRLRTALRDRDNDRPLGGPPSDGGMTVEADDMFLGGVRRGHGQGPAGKTSVIAAVEMMTGRIGAIMGCVRMQVVPAFDDVSTQAFMDAHMRPGTHVHTDGKPCFRRFDDPQTGMTHERTIVGKGAPDRGRRALFNTINTAIANLKTALCATHKSISAKHTSEYLGEFCWRTNHRWSMSRMIEAGCRAIATSTPTTRVLAYA